MENTKWTLELLSAAAEDDGLAEELAGYVERECLISAPRDLKTSVMKRCSQPDVQLAAGARTLSRNTKLLLYSLKVGTAVAASILLLALLPVTAPDGMERERSVPPGILSLLPPETGEPDSMPFYGRARRLTQGLNRLSYELSNWEVYLYDEKEE